jgi:micrococcal nuclease
VDYKYKALVNSVSDGDTLNLDIDLGFGVWLRNQKIRLYGINAPELKGSTKEIALKAKSRLTELVLGKEIIIETLQDKKEKYGRWLGKIFVQDLLINKVLVSEGLAVPFME